MAACIQQPGSALAKLFPPEDQCTSSQLVLRELAKSLGHRSQPGTALALYVGGSYDQSFSEHVGGEGVKESLRRSRKPCLRKDV